MPAESLPWQQVVATSPVGCEEGDPTSQQGAGGRRGTPPCEGAGWAVTGLRRGRARPGPAWGQIKRCLWPLARACDASQLLTVEHHLRAHWPGQEVEHCQSPLPFPLDHDLGARISCIGVWGIAFAFWQLLGGPAGVTLGTPGGACVHCPCAHGAGGLLVCGSETGMIV